MFDKSKLIGWDADLLAANEPIDDGMKADVLGSRRTILFVEGTDGSLDKILYSSIFPNASVVAKGSCRAVEQAVLGIRDSQALHWVSAFGVIDNDGRSSSDCEQLRTHGIYALPMLSVESIYYHCDIQRRATERITGDCGERLADAKSAAIAAVALHVPRLSAFVAERAVRDNFFTFAPTSVQVAAGTVLSFSIDLQAFVKTEEARLTRLLDEKNLAEIIARYPVRTTPALDEISKRLGFRTRREYQACVQQVLRSDPTALKLVQAFFGTLADDISMAASPARASKSPPAQ